MKKKYYKKVMSILLTTGFISSLATAYPSNAQDNTIMKKALEDYKNSSAKSQLSTLDIVPIDVQIDTDSEEEVNVIVELKDEVKTENAEKIKSSHEKFKSHINKLNAKKGNDQIKIKEEFKKAFNGMSLSIKGTQVKQLLESEEVEKVWIDEKVNVLPVADIEQNQTKAKPDKDQKELDSNIQIGADKLHDEKITGKGVKVGVIDTGVDYNHPDLKDNYKGGYDCVNEDDNPMETTYEDWKNSGEPEYAGESYYYTGHGTHVAGTILGNGKSKTENSVLGVAPEADLYAYKVLGPYGSGYSSDIIQGLELAVEDKMDVVNLSLGVSSNNPYSPTSQAVNNATLLGTTVVVSAGNNGQQPGTLGAPGAASFPITVGASSYASAYTYFNTKLGDTEYDLKLIAKDFDNKIEELKNKSYEVTYVEGGQQYHYDRLGIDNLDNQVALIEYDSGSFEVALNLAKEKGAKAIIIYGKYSDIDYVNENKDFVPTFKVDTETGNEIKDKVQNDNNKISFVKSYKGESEGKEEVADFSSQGPSYYEFDIKPDVVAPGVNVYSAVPSYINDKENNNYDYAYARMNGTSMAAPHVAGAAALIKQANKKYTPFDIKESLMNTAEKLSYDYGVNQVGSGRINVYDAANSDLTISTQDDTKISQENEFVDVTATTGSLSFGKYAKSDEDIKVSKKVEIENNFNKDKEFKVDTEFVKMYPAANAEHNKVTLENVPKEIKVDKKKSVTIEPTIVVPKEAENGSYQGYITLTNTKDENETYRVPFSINHTEDGIAEAENLRDGTSTKYEELFDPLVEASLTLNSHMTEMAVYVRDFDTKKLIGISGSGNIEGVPVNVPARLGAFNGYVLPINESGELGEQVVRLSEGDYELVFYTKDALGKEYYTSDYVRVDNTSPEITFEEDSQPGVYELQEGQSQFTIKGKSYDDGLKVAAEKHPESKLDQTWTNMYKYIHENFISLEMFIPNLDGSFEMNHKLDLNKDINKLAVTGIDIFGAGSLKERKDFYVVKPGTKYIYSSFDKYRVNQGDDVNMSVTMKNIEDFKNGEFKVSYINNHIINGVELTEEFKALASASGYEFDIDYKNTDETQYNIYNTGIATINMTKEGEQPLNIDESTPIFKVKIKAENNAYYNPADQEVYEEVLIHEAKINNSSFENILNTTFSYQIAK